MKKEAFKPGQVAYEISPEKGVLLTKLKPTDCNVYTVLGQNNAYTFDGRILEGGRLPSLYHANEDNYKALCGFFGKDAVPELPASPNEIMIELLKYGSHTAMFSNISYVSARENKHVALIISYDEELDLFVSTGSSYGYVIAVDSRGNEITELPE